MRSGRRRAPATDTLRLVRGVTINAACGMPVSWLPDGKALLCQTIPAGRAAPPTAPVVPLWLLGRNARNRR